MAKSLGNFLEMVEEKYPEWFLRITDHLDGNNFDVSALVHKIEQAGHDPIYKFENLTNVLGKRSEFPLAYNVFASRKMIALALGLPVTDWRSELVDRFSELEKKSIEATYIQSEIAPAQEIVLKGEEVDVRKLPIPMTHEKDVGHYFTMTCIMKARSGEFYDSTFTKNMIKGPRKLSISAAPHHHLARIIEEHEQDDLPTPVIIVLGHHPGFFLGTCAITPYGNNDYSTIGGVMEESLRLCPSVTWGEKFLVPADAEMIIEGEIPPGVRELHNPFGEVSGHYQLETLAPIINVTAMTHRRNAIVEGINPGHHEHWALGGVPKEGSMMNAIRNVIPDVQAVHLPLSGCGRFSCYISIKKRFFSDPRKAALVAFAEMPNLKVAIVVDDEIDVFNEKQVLWAAATQTRWDTDLEVIRGIQSFRPWLGHAVAIIDATRPDEAGFPTPNRVPQEALDRMDISKYYSTSS